MDTTSDADFFVLQISSKVLDSGVLLLETDLRITLTPVEWQVAEFVSTWVIRILDELVRFCLFLLCSSQTLSFLGFFGSFLCGSSFFLGLCLCFFSWVFTLSSGSGSRFSFSGFLWLISALLFLLFGLVISLGGSSLLLGCRCLSLYFFDVSAPF